MERTMYRFCDLSSSTKEPFQRIKQKVILFNSFGKYQKQKASIINILNQLNQTKSVIESFTSTRQSVVIEFHKKTI